MVAYLTQKVRRKFQEIKKKGLIDTFRKALRDRIYSHRCGVFLERDPSLTFKSYSRKREWDFRILDPDHDLDKFRENFSRKIPHFEEMFDKGVVAMASFSDNIIVGYMWFATKDVHLRDVSYHLRLQEGEVFQVEGFVLPDRRGTLMMLDGTKFAHEYFRKNGFKKILCLVDIEDNLNMKLHFKIGFEERGAILHVKKFIFFSWKRASVEEYVGTRFDSFKPKRVIG